MRLSLNRCMRQAIMLTVFALIILSVYSASRAEAAGTVAWSIRDVSEPSVFSSSDAFLCEAEEKCDRYQLLVTNIGDEGSSGTITLTDTLPPGLVTLASPESGRNEEEEEWLCTEGGGNATVTCTFSGTIPAGGYAPFLDVQVAAPGAGLNGDLVNGVSVTGGGSPDTAAANTTTPVNASATPFGISEFTQQATTATGSSEIAAGGAPLGVDYEYRYSIELQSA